MVRKTTLCSTLLAAGLLAAAGATPAMAAESRVATDQLTANQTVTISDIPAGHQAGALTLYRIADYTAASVDGTTLVSYDVHATGDGTAFLKPSPKDPSKPSSSASADEQLAYIFEHYKSANNKADNYGLYSSLLRDSVGMYSGLNFGNGHGLPKYPVTFSGTSASIEVPAGVYVMLDTALDSGVMCQASLFATGVGGATTIGDTTLGQTVCKHVVPDAPVKKVIDVDDGNTAKDVAHVSTGDVVTWQISAKAGWDQALLVYDALPSGFEFVRTTKIHTDTKGDWKSEWFSDDKNQYHKNTNSAVSLAVDNGRLWQVDLRTIDSQGNLYGDNQMGSSDWKATADRASDTNLIVNPDETVTITFETRVSDASKVTIDGEGNVNQVERYYNQHEISNCNTVASTTVNDFHTNCGVIAGTSATVKTHQVTLKKTDMSNKALNGAHFTLTRNGEGVEVSNGYVSGYGTATDLNVDGSLTLKGLDTGDYVLTETTAPTGYNTTALPSVTFTMNEDGIITEKSGDLFELVSADNNTVTVKNAKNLTQLPLTGAGGVMLATVVALMLVAAGVVIEARRRA